MTAKFETGDFVHLIGTVDTASGDGKILYVNPASAAVTADMAGDPDFELVVEDAAGQVLDRVHPVVRLATCEGGEPSTKGLIQQDLPRVAGMQRVRLFHKGVEKSRFEAGKPAAAAAMGMAPTISTAAGAAGPHVVAGAGAESGTTYTVQVKSAGNEAWQTIAVGRPTPNIKVDRNQFPGAESVRVRVVRSTGFDEAIVTEEDVDLSG